MVRKAFLDLAKRYHPDSSSPDANIDKFVEIENAFRTLSKYHTGNTNNEEIEKIVFDIKVKCERKYRSKYVFTIF